MGFLQTGFPGLVVFEPNVFGDERGYFFESYNQQTFEKEGLFYNWVQDNQSSSTYGVIRGLHFQIPPKSIDKMITCISGAVLDFVVDMRKGSPTFGDWAEFKLAAGEARSVFVPKGLAHGFFTLTDNTVIQCKSSGVFDGPSDKAISYSTFSFAGKINNPVLSEKDIAAPLFQDFDNPFRFV